MKLLKTNSSYESKNIMGCIPIISIIPVLYAFLRVLGVFIMETVDNDYSYQTKTTYRDLHNPGRTVTKTESHSSAGVTLITVGIILFFLSAMSIHGTAITGSAIGDVIGHNGTVVFYSIITIGAILSLRKKTSFKTAKINSKKEGDSIIYMIGLAISIFLVFIVVISNKNPEDRDYLLWMALMSPFSGYMLYQMILKPFITSCILITYTVFVRSNTQEAKDYFEAKRKDKENKKEIKAQEKQAEKELIEKDKLSTFTKNKVFGMITIALMLLMPFAMSMISLESYILNESEAYIAGYNQFLSEELIFAAKNTLIINLLFIGLLFVFSSENSMPPIGNLRNKSNIFKVLMPIAGFFLIAVSLIYVPINISSGKPSMASKITLEGPAGLSSIRMIATIGEKEDSIFYGMERKVQNQIDNNLKSFNKKELAKGYEKAKKEYSNSYAYISVFPIILYVLYKLFSLNRKRKKLAIAILASIMAASISLSIKNGIKLEGLGIAIPNVLSHKIIYKKDYSSNKKYKEELNKLIKEDLTKIPFIKYKKIIAEKKTKLRNGEKTEIIHTKNM